MASPKVWRIAATNAYFTPTTSCKYFQVKMVAGGGGGAGTSNQHYIPPNQYGARGGDTLFHLKPSVNSMFQCDPSFLRIHCSSDHNLVIGQAVFLDAVPTGITNMSTGVPYYVLNIPTSVSFEVSTTPYSPPFGGQTTFIASPAFQNPTGTWRAAWYGVQGGGGGGIIGDQGTPLGYYGMDSVGPSGNTQSYGVQGGTGNGGFHLGGAGGVNDFGGNSGTSYQDFGIAGTNLTGAGGGGGSPCVSPALDWGGSGGAAGAWGEVFIEPETGVSYFCWAGAGGAGGPAGTDGYPGGAGGHGSITIIEYF